ncbi:MAG: hypothetical protein JW810_07860 [Sedimentisphaerales bacterium]|nr:hypothetical protein [Sedimentisphaerales bacterium]
MKRIWYLFLCVVLVSFGSSVVSAGQIIGQLSDPVTMGIVEFVDISSAWVEKEGNALTFVMELRGNVPEPEDFSDPNTGMTYIWLVDADNNPNTGQSPGWVGSEFNVRVVVSNNPSWVGGFVDVVGALPGGGLGTVAVVDNLVKITIDESQIASPSDFHWRSDAAYWVNGPVVSYNGVTGESGYAQVHAYRVVYETEPRGYSAEASYSAFQCQPGSEDPGLADEVMNNYNSNSSGENPIFLSIDGKYPPESHQILAQAMGHAGFMQVRNFARFDIENADPKAFGQADVTSFFDIRFTLYGPEASGAIPPDTFRFVFNHDFHAFGVDTEGQSHGTSYCQIVITQLDPLTQKGLWLHQRDMWNDDSFGKYEEIIDVADYNLEYGVLYSISGLLSDHARSQVPTFYAESISDSTLTAAIEMAPLPGDVDLDGDVDLTDFARLAENWLMSR